MSLQLLVLLGVRYLQTAMENVLLLGDPELESDGWILEDSLAQTARYNLQVIKNLGKCYQADQDNDHDPNIDRQEVQTPVDGKLKVHPSAH